MKEKAPRLYNVEFLKFVLSIAIVFYHILHSQIMDYTGGAAIYNRLAAHQSNFAIIVDAFFIISGFFLYKSIKHYEKKGTKQFIYSKIKRLWPVLALSVVLDVIFFNKNVFTGLLNITFLQNTGLNKDYLGPNWYISPLFWVSIFFFLLYKNIKNKNKLNFIIGILAYFSYVFSFNAAMGGLSRDVVGYAFCASVFKAIGAMGSGYLMAVCLENVCQMPFIKSIDSSKKKSAAAALIVSAAEIISLIALVLFAFFPKISGNNTFAAIIAFFAFFISLASGRGIFSILFNNKFFGFFGRFSYSIYVMQLTAFQILKRTLWLSTDYVSGHALRCIAISLAVSAMLGVIVYYAVEKPAAILLGKLQKKIFA